MRNGLSYECTIEMSLQSLLHHKNKYRCIKQQEYLLYGLKTIESLVGPLKRSNLSLVIEIQNYDMTKGLSQRSFFPLVNKMKITSIFSCIAPCTIYIVEISWPSIRGPWNRYRHASVNNMDDDNLCQPLLFVNPSLRTIENRQILERTISFLKKFWLI